MSTSQLWYDDSRNPLSVKLTKALVHYKNKGFGLFTRCEINTNTGEKGIVKIEIDGESHNLEVSCASDVIQNHFRFSM